MCTIWRIFAKGWTKTKALTICVDIYKLTPIMINREIIDIVDYFTYIWAPSYLRSQPELVKSCKINDWLMLYCIDVQWTCCVNTTLWLWNVTWQAKKLCVCHEIFAPTGEYQMVSICMKWHHVWHLHIEHSQCWLGNTLWSPLSLLDSLHYECIYFR